VSSSTTVTCDRCGATRPDACDTEGLRAGSWVRVYFHDRDTPLSDALDFCGWCCLAERAFSAAHDEQVST
jgi:hypothetical protein